MWEYGVLHLSLCVGIADADVAVTVQVRPLAASEDVDENGWPNGFFDRVAGSMPELQASAAGGFRAKVAAGMTYLPDTNASSVSRSSTLGNREIPSP